MTDEWDTCPGRSRIEYLEEKDRMQNDKLETIEKKVDRVLWAIIGGLGTVVAALVALMAGGLA